MLILSCGLKSSDKHDSGSNDNSSNKQPSYESGETGKDLSFAVDDAVNTEMDVFIRYPSEDIKDKSVYTIDENLTKYTHIPTIRWSLNEKNRFEGLPIQFMQKNKFNKIQFGFKPLNHKYFSNEYKICNQILNFNKENSTLYINGNINIPLSTHTTCEIEVSAIETHKLTNKETRTLPIKFTVRLNYHFMDWCLYGDPEKMNGLIYTKKESDHFSFEQCSINLFGTEKEQGKFNSKFIEIKKNIVDTIVTDLSPFQTFTNALAISIDVSNLNPLRKLKNLKGVSIINSYISDINAISDLKNLMEIYFNNNEIENISAITNLINLEYIELTSNRIKDISPLGILYKKSKAKKTFVNLEKNDINNFESLQEISSYLLPDWNMNSSLYLNKQLNSNSEDLNKKCQQQVSIYFKKYCPQN